MTKNLKITAYIDLNLLKNPSKIREKMPSLPSMPKSTAIGSTVENYIGSGREIFPLLLARRRRTEAKEIGLFMLVSFLPLRYVLLRI